MLNVFPSLRAISFCPRDTGVAKVKAIKRHDIIEMVYENILTTPSKSRVQERTNLEDDERILGD